MEDIKLLQFARIYTRLIYQEGKQVAVHLQLLETRQVIQRGETDQAVIRQIELFQGLQWATEHLQIL